MEEIDHWNTYSPVVSWSTVLLRICMDPLTDWRMKSIDFVLALHQYPIKADIYMRPPKDPRGFKIIELQHPSDVFTKLYMLLKKNIRF